jgi:hypothetical protein
MPYYPGIFFKRAASVAGSTGFVVPGTGAEVLDTGTIAWTTPGNITVDDAASATANMFAVGSISERLVGSNFGFSALIPGGATAITQIIVRIRCMKSLNQDVLSENALQLTKDAGTTLFSTNKATGTDWVFNVFTNRDFTFASPDAMPSVAEVNASGFGFVLKTTRVSGVNSSNNVRVQVAWINVTYT